MTKKITMDLIKELREKTQVGMMDCKKALIEADGNLEKAVEILRKKGAAVASKRAEHATNNGRIGGLTSSDNTIGSLVEIACETDFSANTDDMRQFAKTLCEQIIQSKQSCSEACDESCLMQQPLYNDANKTIKMLLDELIAKISENIKISSCARFEAEKEGLVNVYIHPGATLGTMIELNVTNLSDTNKEAIKELAKNVCMQIAVTNPVCVDPSQIDQELLEKEKTIIKDQLKASGKPDEIIEKIMLGKINKYFEEVCLLKQKYIKQDKISIENHIKEVEKQTGTNISIKKYKRLAIGK